VSDRSRLDEAQIAARLESVAEWTRTGDSITRTFEAPSFMDGIAFVQKVAGIAESRDHHPDIDIRYSNIKIAVSSHDVGGITERDFRLATAINDLA